MPYDPIIVANAILQRGWGRGLHIDHMKLQKLVFLVHAWSLAIHGTPAVTREPEAWTYGPVFSELYSALRNQSRAAVSAMIPSFNAVTARVEPLIPNQGDQVVWQVVDQVLDRYGQLSAIQLSTLSHESGGPWDQARQHRLPSIPNEVIQNYYREQFRQRTARV